MPKAKKAAASVTAEQTAPVVETAAPVVEVFRPKSLDEMFAEDRKAAEPPQENPAPSEEQQAVEAAEPEGQPEAAEPKAEAESQPTEHAKSEPVTLEDLLREKGIDPSLVKVRTKVGGEEAEVSLEQLRKGYQTDAYLTKRGQQIAEERRKLEAERQKLSRQVPAPAESVQAPEGADDNPIIQFLRKQQQEIEELRSRVEPLTPVVFDANRKRLSDELRAEGFNDFLEYVPKIELAVAQVEDPNLAAYYDTPEGAKSLYFKLKAKELSEKASAPAPAPAPAATKAPASQRPAPPVIKLPTSGGPVGIVEDREAKYREALSHYRKTGDQEALYAAMRAQGL